MRTRDDQGAIGTRTVIIGCAAIVLVIFGIGWLSSMTLVSTNGGEIAVIRNGGPFDNRQIRDVIPPASGVHYEGQSSSQHNYPSQQRFYTITSDTTRGDRTGIDVEHDSSSDGVEMGIEGTVYFTLNTDPATIRSFDNAYGTRTYTGLDGNSRHAYDGTAGWSTFLDQIVRPVISNDFRAQIGDFRCAELIASCALVQNQNQNATAPVVLQATGASNNVNLTKIQAALSTSLQADLDSSLGGHYLTNVRVIFAKVTLPAKLQDAIDTAQAAFAKITESQAKVQQAKADAAANDQKQQGYNQCPACAIIDELHALPPNITTFAPGSGFSLSLGAATPPSPNPGK